MMLIVGLVFVSVFALLALLLLAGGVGASPQTKQTLAHLESALATTSIKTNDKMVDIRKDELLSAIPVIHRWLLKLELAPRLRILLYQANLKWTAGGFLLISAGTFAVVGYAVFLLNGAVLPGLLVGAVMGALPLLYVRHRRQARFDQFEQGLPEALDLMVSALRAGHSMVAAMRLVARESSDPIGVEFRLCFEEQNYGLELRTALQNLVTRMPLQDLRLVSTAILIQRESGGNLAEVLDKAANLIRERFKLKREVRTHTAQGRLTGWILSLMPLVLGVVMYITNPDTISILWQREIGIHLMYGAAIMTLLGTVIIHRIVNMEV